MQAFHNDPSIKAKYITRVESHMAADHLIRGTGWDGFRGGAVGCTLEAYEHARYEAELGIPEWLARVEDTLFEGMSADKARTWPKAFLDAVPVGADLEKVKGPFLVMILESVLEQTAGYPDVEAAVRRSIALWGHPDIGSDEWRTEAARAADAAWAAARAARAADAAWAAARAADAAWAAARAADAAWAAAARAADAAWARYDHFADCLLEMLRDAV